MTKRTGRAYSIDTLINGIDKEAVCLKDAHGLAFWDALPVQAARAGDPAP